MSKRTLIIILAPIVIMAIIAPFLPKVQIKPQPNVVAIETLATKPKPWKKMSYDEKQTWLEKYLSHPDGNGYQLVYQMGHQVKAKFQFPEEVDFDNTPVLNKKDIVDADRPTLFHNGTLTAKNAYGVKAKYSYSIRYVANPDSLFIDNISISPLN